MEVRDNWGKVVRLDDVMYSDNAVLVDIRSHGLISGTWTVAIRTTSGANYGVTGPRAGQMIGGSYNGTTGVISGDQKSVTGMPSGFSIMDMDLDNNSYPHPVAIDMDNSV